MSSRAFKSKGQSLVDYITPANELLDVRAIDKGIRFEFKNRVLPTWFLDLARRLDYAVTDNAPSRLSGRVVSLIDNNKRSRKFLNS